MSKILTFGIPCYNSAEYMDKCIQSILVGANYAPDIEIIIVDDGSTKDDTPRKADEWAERYPNIIRVHHQENGGHGTAVMSGLKLATGTFYKVVDSDDWVDAAALAALLAKMRATEATNAHVDLFITNYVYEHTQDNTRNVVSYRHVLPEGRVFGWLEVGHFQIRQNLLMHALCYRTEVLRDMNFTLPAHTFYVDNIYAWVPLPHCERLCYLDQDLYRYYIGREDQSVNEQIMAGRVDQQVRITRIMMHAYHIYEEVHPAQLRSYMVNYFVVMMSICSVFSRLSERPDAMDELAQLWQELHDYDPRLYRRCRLGFMGQATNLPGFLGSKATIAGYRLANKVVKFN